MNAEFLPRRQGKSLFMITHLRTMATEGGGVPLRPVHVYTTGDIVKWDVTGEVRTVRLEDRE